MRGALLSATTAAGLALAGTGLALADAPHLTFAQSLDGFLKRAPQKDALQVLYDQTGLWSGIGIDSQNFEPAYDGYDCEAADDFVVPRGAAWRVKQIYVMGTHFDGMGPADSENVVFYRDNRGKPGDIVAAFSNIASPDNDGLITIDLGTGVRLRHGHYWISIQANENFEKTGQFGLLTFDSEVFHNRAVWRNPNDGFGTGCTDWGEAKACTGYETLGDYKFALKGKVL